MMRAKTIVAVCAVGLTAALTGCSWMYGSAPAEAPKPVRQEATRLQILRDLALTARSFQSMTAKATTTMIDQAQVVPMSMRDRSRRDNGEPYSKRFYEINDVNGILFMARGPENARNIRFQGDVTAVPNSEFVFIGRNNAFWLVVPNPRRGEDQVDAARGTIYVGLSDRREPRPTDMLSARPQDIWELLVPDEAVAAIDDRVLAFMEVWPDYYILTFINPDWPSLIVSRVWIERENLTMFVHQLFDGSGEVVAEARFRNYRVLVSKEGVGVKLPQLARILWPRDRKVLDISFDNAKVNVEVAGKIFDPVRPAGYEERKVLGPSFGPPSGAPPSTPGAPAGGTGGSGKGVGSGAGGSTGASGR